MNKDKLNPRYETEDSRALSVLEGESFYDVYQPELKDLMWVCGWEDEWSDNSADVNKFFQRFVTPDHDHKGQLELTEWQEGEARTIFRKMGLIDTLLPPPGHYQQAVIHGASLLTMADRMDAWNDMLADGMVKADKTVVLTGPRKHGLRTDLSKEELLGGLEERWGGEIGDFSFVKHERSKGMDAFSDESRLAILALTKVLRHRLQAIESEQAFQQGNKDEDTLQEHPENYWFNDVEGWGEIAISNGPAVDRGFAQDGTRRPSRPTAESTIVAWKNAHPLPYGSQIVSVGDQPHALRLALEVQKQLKDRPDVRIIPAGSSAGTVPISTIFGEVARLIYMGELERSKREIVAA